MPSTALPDDDHALAGELALGLLDGEERAAALRRVLAETEFAAEVEAWRQRFAPLFDDFAETSPPETAWAGIDRALPSSSPAPRERRWQAVAAAATAIAACLALLLLWPRTPEPVPAPAPQPTLIAQLVSEDGAPLLSASYQTDGALRVRTNNLPAGALMPELWVIGRDGTPRSLGLVARNDASAFAPPEGLRRYLVEGSTFALTLEPRAGAPHAAPSGEILATAKLALL